MSDQRAHLRVKFDHEHHVQIMAIDGTWARPCLLNDASETGARLTLEGQIGGLNLKEFFLLLSSTGLAFRRCELAWVNGQQIGVRFLKRKERGASSASKKAQVP